MRDDRTVRDDYDFIVVGSGFGGSVSALRLAEKGYRVAVIEQGRRINDEDRGKAEVNARHLFWEPMLGLRGIFSQVLFRHMAVIRGIGVGGGSLVYAAVLLRPKPAFFSDAHWAHLANWQAELPACYDRAEQMLGVQTNPRHTQMDDWLQQTAETLGVGASFGAVPQGIFFGAPGETVPDPYFNGEGPDRRGCTFCGRCVAGCKDGAKNSLDRNYLYLAEKHGVTVIPETQVTNIVPLSRGYMVVAKSSRFGAVGRQHWRADKVVLAGGVLGTLELLFRCRDIHRSLPRLSSMLGQRVRTNSEALVASVSHDSSLDLTEGTTISSDFYYDAATHITQNRLPPSHHVMRHYFGPLIDDLQPLRRALQTLKAYVTQPRAATASWFGRDWHKRTSLLTVMQNVDSHLRLRYGRSPWRFGGRRLITERDEDQHVPSYLPQANHAARVFAEVSGGTPQNIVMESIGNLSLTAHILGGCVMGASAETGVVDAQHQVFGYPGLYVVDGSVVPANIGVNPSLTITALAERAMALIPPRA